VQFDGAAELEVEFWDYEDDEQLRRLREQLQGTHVVRSHRDRSAAGSASSQRRIIALPAIANAEPAGGQRGSITLGENLGHVAALVRESLITYLASLPRKVYGYQPVQFLAEGTSDDLLRQGGSDHGRLPDWLGVHPLYEIDVRVMEFARNAPFLGMFLNVCARRRIDATCRELAAVGFSVAGRYVGTRHKRPDARMQVQFRLVGRVETIKDGRLQLADHREGESQVPDVEAFIDSAAFWDILDHCAGDRAASVRTRLDQALATFHRGPELLARLDKLRGFLAKQKLELAPGLSWTCDEFVSQAKAVGFPRIESAPSVVYVFDPTGRKTDTWHDRGMDQHGPYSTPTFSPSELQVCVVCQKQHRGRVEQFVKKFLEGIAASAPQHGGRVKRQPFTKGFVRKYALQDATTTFFEVPDKSAGSYRKAVHQALEFQRERGVSFHVALVETEEAFHRLKGDQNPYLVTKAELLSHHIPVQEFEFETTEISDNRLQYVLNNMGLATYAKLGGIPWLIKSHPPIAHELVIGLGSASVGEGRLGERERIVGITTVFNGDGNYCVSTVSKAVSFADYEAELLSSLKQTISQVSKSLNWQPRQHVRLVFHSFKPFKQVEEDAVKSLVAALGDYQVDYAFIHVVESHPVVLFDEAQPGVWAEGGGTKGAAAPPRGAHFRLSHHESLIVLTGARELKQASDGMPRPVILRLGRGSTFTDLTYLSRQVNSFACHSWRSYFPSPLPVTLMYSALIAGLLGKLGSVSFWNPSQMYGKIGDTRWFL